MPSASDTVLVIGSEGRMGRRYMAILRALRRNPVGYDPAVEGSVMPEVDKFRRVIIASPTETHYDWLCLCVAAKVRFVLCEKPLCMDSAKCNAIKSFVKKKAQKTDIRVVCNWSYVLPWRLTPNSHSVYYKNWLTGPHGGEWDCCQLHYLSTGRAQTDEWNTFSASIDYYELSLTDIDRSYVAMIRDWLDDPTCLWGLADAIKMERKVEDIIRCKQR